MYLTEQFEHYKPAEIETKLPSPGYGTPYKSTPYLRGVVLYKDHLRKY